MSLHHSELSGLFVLYGNEVRNRIALKLGSREEVDDLTQEVFLLAHRAFLARKIDHPRAYLYKITSSVVTDYYRRGRKHFLHQSDFQPEEGDLQLANPGPNPEESAIGDETWHCLSAAMARLPARVRQAILLRSLEGLSYREVAQRMGISIRTVEKHVARGLADLRASVQ